MRRERLEKHPRRTAGSATSSSSPARTYYHAGDTDHAPELDDVRTDVAFVPIGGTFTMDPEEAGGLVTAIGPQLAVPFHFGFVVGSPSDAGGFRAAAAPVPGRGDDVRSTRASAT